MQVCPRDARPHRSIDEFSHRYTHPVTIRVPYIELDFFDRRDGSRDTVVSLLHFGEIGREQASTLDIAKDELPRSEEHTSELQSLRHLVCRLLLEKKKYK